MARTSQRLSTGTGPTPTHKRAVSSTAAPASEAKKAKTDKVTPLKSQYFDDYSHAENEDPLSSEDDAVSEFGGEGDEEGDGDERSEPADDDDYDSEAEAREPRKKAASRKTASILAGTKASTSNEIWREGVSAGLGPGNQVVIKKPKARTAGKTPYRDETIHPNTFFFLADLKQNNDRQWLKMHDADFRQSERDWYSFVEKLTERLTEIDETIPELPVKDVVFRIYRDIRFSPDPTPYKPYFSVAFSRTGRKGPYAHYYVQIAPDESFVGGGLWHPEAAPVAAMRNDIDQHPRRIRNVLMDDRVREEFLNGAPKSEAKALQAFVAGNSENALKTKPKGYDADHADIGLLRLRNYTMGRKLQQSELLGGRGLNRVSELLASLRPFITYLNSVVMPDETPGSDDVEDDDGSEDNGEE